MPAAHPPPHQLPRAPGEAGTKESDSEGRADALLKPWLLLHYPGCLEGFFWPEELTPGFQVGTTSPQRLGAQVFILALGRHLQKQPLGFRLHTPLGWGQGEGGGRETLSFAGARKVKDTHVLPSFIASRSLHQAPEVGALRAAFPPQEESKWPSIRHSTPRAPSPPGPWLARAAPPFRETGKHHLREVKGLVQGKQPARQRAESSPPTHGHLACQAHYWTDPGRRQSPE